jgi:hypothetical protein
MYPKKSTYRVANIYRDLSPKSAPQLGSSYLHLGRVQPLHRRAACSSDSELGLACPGEKD